MPKLTLGGGAGVRGEVWWRWWCSGGLDKTLSLVVFPEERRLLGRRELQSWTDTAGFVCTEVELKRRGGGGGGGVSISLFVSV